MRVILVLPPRAVAVRDFQRCLNSLAINFSKPEVTVAGFAEHVEAHRRALEQPVEVYSRETALTFDRVVYIEVTGDTEAQEAREVENRKVFRFNFSNAFGRARLARVGGDMDSDDYPALNAHVFNRLSPHAADMPGFYYFPYGYLFRCVGLGPLNEFGHRIAVPLSRFERRPREHKLIMIFGGSAAWSLDCLHSEMFASRLEVKLNEWSAGSGRGLRFTVLNMGQHGNVVLNEIISFTLYCPAIRPDVVIGHDGINDLGYGLIGDPALVAHMIVYQHNLESWSQILHDTKSRPTTFEGETIFQLRNTPEASIRAYVRRVMQFAQLANSYGGFFIWGLQPFIESKRALSPDEEAHIRQSDPYKSAVGDYYKNVKFVYETMAERVQQIKSMNFINFHERFAQFGADRYLFPDFVHLTPEGDDIVAEMYRDYVVGKIEAGELFA